MSSSNRNTNTNTNNNSRSSFEVSSFEDYLSLTTSITKEYLHNTYSKQKDKKEEIEKNMMTHLKHTIKHNMKYITTTNVAIGALLLLSLLFSNPLKEKDKTCEGWVEVNNNLVVDLPYTLTSYIAGCYMKNVQWTYQTSREFFNLSPQERKRFAVKAVYNSRKDVYVVNDIKRVGNNSTRKVQAWVSHDMRDECIREAGDVGEEYCLGNEQREGWMWLKGAYTLTVDDTNTILDINYNRRQPRL